FHRDIPKAAISAWRGSDARLAKVAGDEHDAVLVADRATATTLAGVAAQPGALAAEVRALEPVVAQAPVPYLGFTPAAPGRAALRRAARQPVWPLRKSADGFASKLLNRKLSLPMTWLLMRTRVIPNHVTIAALVCAMAGAAVIAQGGYRAGVIGMLLVNLGS